MDTGVVPGGAGAPMGMPFPGFNAGAPGIVGIVPAIPGTPEGIMVGGTLLVGVPTGIALVWAMPGMMPGIELVGVTPGITPGTMAGGVLVAPGIPGTPARNPCNKVRKAMTQNRFFFMSGLSLACYNHLAFKK